MAEPRGLSDQERGVIRRILDAGTFRGVRELRAQIDSASVSGGEPTFLDLVVDAAASPATCPDGPVPVRAFVFDSSGEPEGEFLVWVTDGYLSALEYAWVTDETPAHIPGADRLLLERVD